MNTRVLNEQHGLPLLVEAEEKDLAAWYGSSREWVANRLLEHGAVLLRGFEMNDQAGFAVFARAVFPELSGYAGGNSPRCKLAEGVYTSTEYPARYEISLHNELSYAACWPARIMFGCVLAAQTGGETPIADSRAILRAIPAGIVEEFRKRQIRYVRNLHGGTGAGASWQATFECNSRAAVERAHRASYDEFEWTPEGGLRLASVRPAIVEHPVTGEAVWFNQAEQFHPSSLGEALRASMLKVYGGQLDRLPQYVTFGDGEAIPPFMLDAIREAMKRNRVIFAWQRGDVLLLDNMLTCHGRMPFTGPRLILVAMSG